ncbi:putative ABC transporter ATP-binding protein YxlF [Corynebacterium capitovis DSM 44611]|uniref:ABC transporter ATP-binding protein n=1 Tax=Corynebacterium capitovis TaxID=131081 RepID=UPI000362B5D8|nr:ATP-binding cassette domain-containing protein [Corynebacterium capitovis]WKD58209.1 putative ABC transporter ATP-binding protein YxlF [Corynebacterium capitovis DSM 44611]
MIDVRELSKTYGRARAVDNLTFTVEPGAVTGFLGPNGAGKSTTMRIIVGLDAPTSGSALIDGLRYRDLPHPARTVGAVLDATAAHPGRTAYNTLLWQAHAAGIPRARVDEVLDLVGLSYAAGKRVGGFSLGMHQRLGIASALLGDPSVLVLDEPINGLDPEGIRWVRTLLRELASEGRTVLVSSHALAEMAQTAQRLVVIDRGRLVADTSVDQFVDAYASTSVYVRAAAPDLLASALDAEGIAYARAGAGFSIRGRTAEEIGAVAFAHRVQLAELSEHHASLEDAYLHSTEDDRA